MAIVVEEMIARLGGDGSGYRRMLADAVTQTGKATEQIESTLGKTEGFFKKWLPTVAISSAIGAGITFAFTQLKDSEWFEGIKESVDGVVAKIKAQFKQLQEWIDPYWESFKETAVEAFESLQEAVGPLWDYIVEKTTALGEALKPVWNKIKDAGLATWNIVAYEAGLAWDYIEEKAPVAWEAIKTYTLDAYQAALDYAEQNKTLIYTLVGVAGAVATAVVAYKAMVLALATAQGLMALLHVQQVATTAAWIVWSGAVLAGQAAMWLWNTAAAVTNLLMGAGATGAGLWATVSGAAAAATALWTTAVTALAGAFTLANIAAFATTAGVLAVTLTAVGVAFYAVYEAGKAAIETLANLPTAGPFEAISKVLTEWNDILWNFVAIAKEDVPGAFQYAAAAAQLAASQIRDLWPPIWEFLKAGFLAVWGEITTNLELSFINSASKVRDMLVQYLPHFGLLGDRNTLEADRRAADNAVEQAKKAAAAVAKMQAELAGKNFKNVESAATKELRDRLEAIGQELIPKGADFGQKKLEEATVAADKYGASLEKIHARARDNVAFGSLAHLIRIEEQAAHDVQRGGGVAVAVEKKAGNEPAKIEDAKSHRLLGAIAGLLTELINKPAVVLEDADAED